MLSAAPTSVYPADALGSTRCASLKGEPAKRRAAPLNGARRADHGERPGRHSAAPASVAPCRSPSRLRTERHEHRSAPPATQGSAWLCGRSACPRPSRTGHEKGTCRQAPNPVWRRVFILPLAASTSLRHQTARRCTEELSVVDWDDEEWCCSVRFHEVQSEPRGCPVLSYRP